MRKSVFLHLFLLFAFPVSITAQVGDLRNDFSVGVNGGFAMGDVGFVPKVTQGWHNGFSGGLSMRYLTEKYFSMLCSIYAEVNYSQLGWKENIVDFQDQQVINPQTSDAETYSRTINYIHLPILARLGWGKEQQGLQFFVQAGPQFGYYLGEKTDASFDIEHPNLTDRANTEVMQYGMAVEHKFDYGITAGIGFEYSLRGVGHVMLDGRYYYGLGNIYKETKKDYFAKSNISSIVIKLTYLFDLTKTK